MSIKKKKRPVLGYLPINVDNNSSSHNNTLNVSTVRQSEPQLR